MRITAIEEYGLRCLLHVVRETELGKSVTIREVAEKERLSMEYATKLMMRLRKASLIKSIRGIKGGYSLTRPAQEVSVAAVMHALDDSLGDEESQHLEKFCNKFSGLEQECVHIGNCAIRPLWSILSQYFYGVLSRINLKQLLDSEIETAKLIQNTFREHVRNSIE